MKYIGYGRYFPQIWAIFPLAVMNFACTVKPYCFKNRLIRSGLHCAVWGLVIVLTSLAALSFMRSVAYQGRMMVQERFRQNLIATFPSEKEVKVDEWSYRFTNVVRFKQAGVPLVKSKDGNVDTVMQKDSALPCYDKRPDVYEDLNRRFPICDSVRSLVCDYRWLDVFNNMPHVLWD